MRVLYVNHTSEVSGSERSLLMLLDALPREIEPCVATPPGALASAVGELGIGVCHIPATAGSLRLHPLHTPRALAEMSFAALRLRRAARRQGADIVDANSIRAGIELSLAAVPGVASIVHVRDCLPPGPVTTATMHLITRSASTVIANSRYTASAVRDSAPRAEIAVVHPGIDLARFDPAHIEREAARARLGRAGTPRVLLGVVAQLSEWKGQHTAIEALKLLRDAHVDAELLLIGSAKFVSRATRLDNEAYVAKLRRLIADLGLSEHVSLLGERDDVPTLIRALDVLLLPSEQEPFGRALLEAMALEVPVLATSAGGPRELVRDGRDGYLVAPGEPAQWALAAQRIVERPDRGRALGRAARERVAEAFSAGQHARATVEIYERALSARRAA